jgi:hypothetical protein
MWHRSNISGAQHQRNTVHSRERKSPSKSPSNSISVPHSGLYRYDRCSITQVFLLGWAICVSIFGIISVQQHQNSHPDRVPVSGLRTNSLSSRNIYNRTEKPSGSSSLETRSRSTIDIQKKRDVWMQSLKHSTEEMFKLSMQHPFDRGNGESKPAPGVSRDVAMPMQTDQSDNSQNKYLASMGGLPDWAGRGDHKLAIGNTDPWSYQGDNVEPQCTSFDHSIKRPRHGCDANKDTRNVFCNFDQLRIDNSKIEMDQGGEALSTVMGRVESVEFPKYQRGAFAVSTKPNYQVPMELRSNLHYLEDVLNAIRYPTEKNNGKINLSCDETYAGITLLTTRYEYVNLYHTVSDWWSVYFVMPDDYWQQPHRVVVLDGHAQGGLDDVWKVLFGDFHFIKHLPKNKGLCFERAVFAPAGYKAPLFPDIVRTRCPNQTMATEFANFVLGRYNLQSLQPIRGNIVIVDRQPYVSHPRSDVSKFQRKSNNLEKLQSTLEKISGVTVQLVRLETHTFGEQLKLVRQAHVLIGNHGAALTHLMFMDPRRSHVIEFTVAFQDFFHYLSEWRGINIEMIQLLDQDLGDEQISKTIDLVRGFMAMPVATTRELAE